MSKIMELADAYAEQAATHQVHAKERAALAAEVEKLEAKLAEAVSRLVTANQESHAWKYDCDALREKLAAVEKDAARYQFVRQADGFLLDRIADMSTDGAEFDTAIDAAMRETK